MSGDVHEDTSVGSVADTTTDYGEMLDTVDVAIEEARYKIENGRVRSPENEKVRQGWVRALAYALNIRRQIASERDLEELAEKVEQLQEEHNT